MIPWHVVSGMNGAIMVLPRGGLKDENGNPVKYEKAYYIGEQDYYLPQGEDGKYIRFNSPLEGFGKTCYSFLNKIFLTIIKRGL